MEEQSMTARDRFIGTPARGDPRPEEPPTSLARGGSRRQEREGEDEPIVSLPVSEGVFKRDT